MELFATIVSAVDAWIWGLPMVVILSATHIFSTFKTGFIQRKILTALKLSFSKDKDAQGDISQFGALCTALSGTLGVGCIVGVATAIIFGGPGAVFWMWIIGVFGMATKYSETYIAIKYRGKDKYGQMCGGAMYVWDRAFCKKTSDGKKTTPWWAKIGAVSFAIFTAIASFGIGAAVQSYAISTSITYFYPFIPEWSIALVVCILVASVVFGGVKIISTVCEHLVPFMIIAYLAGAIVLLVFKADYIFPAISLILQCAFSSQAAFGGAVGSGIQLAMQYGMARGLFSNESGLGTAPIVAAAATTKNPARQSLVAMTGAFWSTVLICAITGIALVSCMLSNPDLVSANPQTLTLQAFQEIPYVGGPVLVLSIIMFAFSTTIGWSYYANRAIVYLFGNKGIKYYMFVYILVCFIGGSGIGGVVWDISDIVNALMALPNIILIFVTSSIISKETKYFVWNNHLDEARAEINEQF